MGILDVDGPIVDESGMSYILRNYIIMLEYYAEKKGIKEGIKEGIKIGKEKGIQKGLQKGGARVLLSLIESKFKTIPQKYKQQINKANQDIILTWANRLLTAEALEEIFA